MIGSFPWVFAPTLSLDRLYGRWVVLMDSGGGNAGRCSRNVLSKIRGECVEAVAVHPFRGVGTARKQVTGSEHGVRRQRGFRFGGGQQSLRF